MKAQQDALAELKQDDKVASEYRGRYEVHTISKVTPTGQIVLEDGSRWKNGRKMGESGGWYSSYLYPLTPAIAEKVRRQNAREYIDYVLNRLPRKEKGEATCVPKEQNEQTMPLWAQPTPGNRGPSRPVPAVLGGGWTRLP